VRDPYRILGDLRAGRTLEVADLEAVARGAAAGTWSDAQLGAFLMGAAIRGLDPERTRALTLAMLDSGERWELSREQPRLADKHSTGGVGDKVSIVLAPLLAACDVPVVMLTGRGLGHTGGTADKLESIPGLRQELDRAGAARLLTETGMALGLATAGVAPADRKLYALRDRTATVDSLPLIVASILSKKLASGAAAIAFDVKCGDGAFLADPSLSRELATQLVGVTRSLGTRASALITDMSQPLGDWSGHAAEIREALDCLEGGGAEETVALTLALAAELGGLLGVDLGAARCRAALGSGRARERFARWAVAQGASAAWFDRPELPLAPVERVLVAPRAGVLARVATRQLGLLLGEAGGARRSVGADLDRGIALRYRARLGRRLESGEELARVYLRGADADLEARFAACFEIAAEGSAPPLIAGRVPA
jgi:pyrimidine-nucleoside phosphorylase